MAKRRRYSPEQIITKLGEAEVRCASAREKQLGRHAKPWKSASRPTTAGEENTGEWM
jgi:hypothetical protein